MTVFQCHICCSQHLQPPKFMCVTHSLPDVTGAHEEEQALTTTHCILPVRNDSIHFKAWPPTPIWSKDKTRGGKGSPEARRQGLSRGEAARALQSRGGKGSPEARQQGLSRGEVARALQRRGEAGGALQRRGGRDTPKARFSEISSHTSYEQQ